MTMQTQRFSRRPFDVEAIQVKKGNMEEVAEWCKGEVVLPNTESQDPSGSYIQVDVLAPASERQSRAFPGDWVLLLQGGKSFKVYTPKAFNKNFVLSENQDAPEQAKKADKPQQAARKQTAPTNGIKPEQREALRRMSEAGKKVAPAQDETPAAVQEAPELQVVNQPVENTTEPKLEVNEPTVQPTEKPGRKFKQV